jgi:hypothetical protein
MFRSAAGKQPAVPNHPYHPQSVEIRGYQANATPVPILLASFSSILAIIVVSALLLARRSNARLSAVDQLLISWFVLCRSSSTRQCHELSLTICPQAARCIAFLKVGIALEISKSFPS